MITTTIGIIVLRIAQCKIRSGFVIEQLKLRFTLFCLKKQDYETYENRFFTNLLMDLNLLHANINSI